MGFSGGGGFLRTSLWEKKGFFSSIPEIPEQEEALR